MIVKKFQELFKKSAAEFTPKFVCKCCQIVSYELSTEAYARHELRCVIQDPQLYEYFPQYHAHTSSNQPLRMKPKRLRRGAGFPGDSSGEGGDEAEKSELACLSSCPAIKAWREYKSDSHHSLARLKDQRERIMGHVQDLDKRFTVYQSRLQSMKGVRSPARGSTAGTSSTGVFSSMAITDPVAWTETVLNSPEGFLLTDKSVEEMIISNDTYNAQMRSSQLSPFMARYAGKHLIPHDVMVPLHLPDDVHLRGRLAQQLRHVSSAAGLRRELAGENQTGTIVRSAKGEDDQPNIEHPRIIRPGEPIRPMPCVCGASLTEFCKKRNIPAEQIGRFVAENHAADKEALLYERKTRRYLSQQRKRQMEDEEMRPRIRPEKKLAEPTLFNELYSGVIRERIDDCAARHRLVRRGLRSRSQIARRVSTAAPSEQCFSPRPAVILRGETPHVKKARLTNVIRKLAAKYADKQELADAGEREKTQVRMDQFTKRMRTANEDTRQKLIEARSKIGIGWF